MLLFSDYATLAESDWVNEFALNIEQWSFCCVAKRSREGGESDCPVEMR
jgi:hypothetical protein